MMFLAFCYVFVQAALPADSPAAGACSPAEPAAGLGTAAPGAMFAPPGQLLLALQLFVESYGHVLDDGVGDFQPALQFLNELSPAGAEGDVHVEAFALFGHAVGHLARTPLLDLFDLAPVLRDGVLHRRNNFGDFLFRCGRKTDENQIVHAFFHGSSIP
jgi:hypothetical protein